MDAKKEKYKQYYTPEDMARYMIEQLPAYFKPKSVIDLAVGSGVLLKQCTLKWGNIALFGVDIDKEVFSHENFLNVKVKCFSGNALQDSLLKEILRINKGKFDLGVANPPFSKIKDSKFNRIEGLFIEKYTQILRNDGFLLIILPCGILTSNNSLEIRDFILKHYTVLKIIDLPDRMFEKVEARVAILVLQKNKTEKKADIIKVDKNFNSVKKINVKQDQLREKMDFSFHDLNNMPGIKIETFIKEFYRGRTVYGDKRFFVKRGRRYLHSYHINEIGIDYSKKELYIQPGSVMDSHRAWVKKGDIVMVRVGRNKAGLMAVVDSQKERGVASDCINIIRLSNINPYYFVLFFKTSYGKERINKIVHGSCSNIISKRDFMELTIPLINRFEQQYYAMEYKKILKKYRLKNTPEHIILRCLNNLILELEQLLGDKYYGNTHELLPLASINR